MFSYCVLYFLLVLHRSVWQIFDTCMSPTASGLKSKRPAGHLADLRHSWSQCAPKMVKALSAASADDGKNSTGVMQCLFDVRMWSCIVDEVRHDLFVVVVKYSYTRRKFTRSLVSKSLAEFLLDCQFDVNGNLQYNILAKICPFDTRILCVE